MIKIFIADKRDFPSSKSLIAHILSNRYGEKNYQICKTEHGKPYLQGVENESVKHLSVSHTKETYFILFSSENAGIDAELSNRNVRLSSVLKKLNEEERSSIRSKEDFLKVWTAKESVVKYLGEKLATHLKRICVVDDRCYLDGELLPISLQWLSFDEHTVCVCSKENTPPTIERLSLL